MSPKLFRLKSFQLASQETEVEEEQSKKTATLRKWKWETKNELGKVNQIKSKNHEPSNDHWKTVWTHFKGVAIALVANGAGFSDSPSLNFAPPGLYKLVSTQGQPSVVSSYSTRPTPARQPMISTMYLDACHGDRNHDCYLDAAVPLPCESFEVPLTLKATIVSKFFNSMQTRCIAKDEESPNVYIHRRFLLTIELFCLQLEFFTCASSCLAYSGTCVSGHLCRL